MKAYVEKHPARDGLAKLCNFVGLAAAASIIATTLGLLY